MQAAASCEVEVLFLVTEGQCEGDVCGTCLLLLPHTPLCGECPSPQRLLSLRRQTGRLAPVRDHEPRPSSFGARRRTPSQNSLAHHPICSAPLQGLPRLQPGGNLLGHSRFTQAMRNQPRMDSLDTPTAYQAGLVLLGAGSVLVLSSFSALGFTGTFLGDYFGILKEARVTTFPFNILDNPMYWGSTANYLGWAVMHASPAGLLLTGVVALVYTAATLYEEPFTAEIYRQKASQSRKSR
ncbi:phosphatidylethanolamine N-methyltransferase isoform X2 [Myotis yumanensis]|uniref:phosphatidylethanolamine N-methyltransferase isoform X2 n=1 Tax=Myotis yumanensis TaxID=159337 RepID=UPI0038D3EC4C